MAAAQDNDFWQEGLLHMAVSGVPQFHHFNDWMNVDGATQQNQLESKPLMKRPTASGATSNFTVRPDA